MLANLNRIQVRQGSKLVLKNDVDASNLRDIYNYGGFVNETQLLNLYSVYNAPNAQMELKERTVIKGRNTSATENLAISRVTGLRRNQISLFNEGKIIVTPSPSQIGIQNRFDNGISDVDIHGSYVASKNASLILDDGYIRANNCYNDGLIYSPKELKYRGGTLVNKAGRMAAETKIIYDKKTATIDRTIQPVVRGNDKTLQLNSDTEVDIYSPINWNVDLNIKAPSFKNHSNITVRKFGADVNSFENYNTISAKNGVNVRTLTFKNTSGRIQSHGDISINARWRFRNEGGKNVPQEFKQFAFENGQLIEKAPKIFYRDVYHADLEKAGVITSGGFLNINPGFFDNSFGILNAAKMQIVSAGAVKNENGLIYSGGTTYISGTKLQNGYRKGSESIEDVDPNAPIMNTIWVPYQVWIEEGHPDWCRGHQITGKKKWVNTSHFETRYRSENILVGYYPRL